MKQYWKKITAMLVGSAVLCQSLFLAPALAATPKPEEEMRAVWISTVYRADFPTVQNNAEAQKKEFVQKLDQIQAMGLNTVVVQVRPKGDALYQSELNPWSDVLTGIQGSNPGYDPMQFMIEETHKRGMEFHAWMNPYRITTSGVDLAALSVDNQARQHPDWILTHNNAMYYNPEREEVKEYIVNTVAEVVQKYDVDGIHFDDYFYPSNYPLPEGEGPEGAAANARREHVNDLISRVDKKIHSIKPNVAFGISPMGIWKNAISDPAGSATKGSEGYYNVFGDAKKWVEKGWVDYIVPQIYWETGHASADYETLVQWWSDVVRGTDVELYIGHGVYKDSVAEEITKELQVNEKYPEVCSSFFFSLRDLLNDRQGAGTALKTYYAQKDAAKQPEVKPEIPAKPEKPEPPTPSKPSATKQAYAGRTNLKVDGKPVVLDVYIIDDYSYFKLRDLAYQITGTPKQFDTIWLEKDQAIHLQTGIPYTVNGVEGKKTDAKDAMALPSTANLYVDGQKQMVSAYTIHDYTYYKLRDIAKLVDFGVTWDEKTATIGIDTKHSYQ